MPNGTVITEANAAAFGVAFQTTGNTKAASFGLPIPFQATKTHSGTWHAVLEI